MTSFTHIQSSVKEAAGTAIKAPQCRCMFWFGCLDCMIASNLLVLRLCTWMITIVYAAVPLLRGRTALDCYFDFMSSFHQRFKHLYADQAAVIHEVTVGTPVSIQPRYPVSHFGVLVHHPSQRIQTVLAAGMGPQGELRYPSFRSERWTFPGIGEFQCFDVYMLSMLQAAALDLGQAEYGSWGPHDAGSYCMWPSQTKFFRCRTIATHMLVPITCEHTPFYFCRDNGSWSSEYGQFFLNWYSVLLLNHADSMLEVASKVFGSSPIQLQVKLPAVYWWHHTQSHAVRSSTPLVGLFVLVIHLPFRHGSGGASLSHCILCRQS